MRILARLATIVMITLGSITLGSAAADARSVFEPRGFSSPERERLYHALVDEVRCLVCQNQTIAESNADLASDLRREVYRMVEDGRSEAEIAEFMVARYGDFVLYRPPLRAGTVLLWAGPFLLAAVGTPLGLFLGDDYQLFLATAILSMTMAPVFIHFGPAVVERVERYRRDRAPSDGEAAKDAADHTIVVGYGLAGRSPARVRKAAGLGCVVVEQNPDLVCRARSDGLPVIFGDGAEAALLDHAGGKRARVVIFAISSPSAERRGVAVAREMNPGAHIIVRTRFVRAIDDLLELGATDVVVEEFEASLELFARALESYEIPVNRIWRELEAVRAEHYGLFRDRPHPDLRLDALKHLGVHDALEIVEVEPGSAALGGSAASLDLRKQTGAMQIAVIREARPIHENLAETTYEAGDTVVLIGNPTSLEAALELFRSHDAAE